jgi:hypothetical protein
MAKKSNNIFNNTLIGSGLTSNASNAFTVNSSSGDNAITVGPDGYCVINKLALVDDITGNKWEVRVSNGEIIVEPCEIEDKREFRINKVLKND